MTERYVSALQTAFEAYRNHDNAEPMKKYMKHQFVFLGIKTPERRKILNHFLKEHDSPSNRNQLFEVIEALWELPEREFQYIALDLLAKPKQMKDMGHEWVKHIESLIVSKSWWDTVDALATIAGEYFRKYPDEIDGITRRWIDSDNDWLKRSALLFQLKYKEDTDEERLFEYILLVKDSDEFFIQKAIGWALREYSKTAPEKVKEFVYNHSLKPLSSREALKFINKSG